MSAWPRTGLLWGAGTLVWLLGLVAVGPLAGGDTVGAVASVVVDSSPGSLATFAIETFGRSAQPLLVAGLGIGTVLTGALVGIALDRRGLRIQESVVLGTFVVVASAGILLAVSESASIAWLLATLLALVPPGLLWWIPKRSPEVSGRRRALRRFGAAVGAVTGVGLTARALDSSGAESGPQPGDSLSPVEEKTAVGTTTPSGASGTVTETAATAVTEESPPTLAGPSGEAAPSDESQTANAEQDVEISTLDSDEPFGFDFQGMPKAVGPADAHYVVDKNFTDPDVDASEWTLDVQGAVDSPYSLSFEELADHPDARDMVVTTECISNPVGGRLVSTAEWQVVPVRSLLEDAGVDDDAFDVVTKAVDGYSETLPWTVVVDREDVVLAFGMDGQALPREHGFPVRLLVPGRYGMKSTKWVEAIEVARTDEESYWESRGWVAEAVVHTMSYIRAVQRRGDRVAVGGIAYGGQRGIDSVEVTVDGGDSWAVATVEEPPSPYAWRRWRHVVERPPESRIDVLVRAVDGEGNVQTREESPPHPGGSTGWHRTFMTI